MINKKSSIQQKKKSVESEIKKQVLQTKQSLYWHFAYLLLQNYENNCELMSDKVFRDLFIKLREYVSNKIAPPEESDITDLYVIMEHTAINE